MKRTFKEEFRAFLKKYKLNMTKDTCGIKAYTPTWLKLLLFQAHRALPYVIANTPRLLAGIAFRVKNKVN